MFLKPRDRDKKLGSGSRGKGKLKKSRNFELTFEEVNDLEGLSYKINGLRSMEDKVKLIDKILFIKNHNKDELEMIRIRRNKRVIMKFYKKLKTADEKTKKIMKDNDEEKTGPQLLDFSKLNIPLAKNQKRHSSYDLQNWRRSSSI